MKKFFSKTRGKTRRKPVNEKKMSKVLDWVDFDDEDLDEEEEEYEDEEEIEEEEEYEEDEIDDEYKDEDEDDEEYEEEYDDVSEEDEDDEVEEIEEIENDDEEDEIEDDEEEEYEDEEEIEEEEEYDEEEYDEEDEIDDEYEDEEEYDEYEDEDEEYYGKKPEGFRKVIFFFSNMSIVDHVVAFTGIIVLALGILAGVLYFGAKSDEKQIAAFAEVGEGIEEIPVIGESGLLAISDAQTARLLAAEMEEIEQEAVEQEEESSKTEIAMNLTSIQKDLKIKFTNKNTGKLIPSVAFEVEIVAPSGDTYVLIDEDKDGIIYQKDIASGKYKVAIIGPSDLKGYSFSSEAIAITVRDTIEYKKVEVADEIKTESEVNAAVEDTAVNETVVESTNTDTVEWVESTKTLIEGTETTSEGYERVDRSEITDPSTKAAIGFRLLTEENPTQTPENGSGSEEDTNPTEEPTPDQTEEPTPEPTAEQTEVPTAEPTPEPTAESIPTPTVKPTEKPTQAPTVKPTALPTAAATATPTVSPTATPKPTTDNSARTDTSTDLLSNSGDKLYVLNSDGSYREAKYADYFDDNIKEFYKKTSKTTGEYRYTGWQTIDGSTYYFDKNGNYVTGKQIIQGAEYNFNENGVLDNGSGHLGIDVSKWNGNIDWNAVKNSGVSYAIIRCGYRGSTTGALIEDPMFRSNIQGAQNAGIKVGVYFFTQAISEVEAVEEASMVLSLIKGYNITYPIFLDVEPSNGRGDGISVDTRTAVCKAFCQTIQNSGYKAGIYANKTWFNEKINTPSLTGYKIWLAQYAAAPTYTRTKYDMWQYSSTGKISGISGNVDMNISYLGY
ncbi:MAG: GH25 family lysozyme [Suilimivivens sp.]